MSRLTQEIQGVIISPPLPEGATTFALSDGDWIEKIKRDADSAFEGSKYRYVEVFDAAGEPLITYMYFDQGSLSSDPEFEGYAED